jgi:hypothetical protein
LDTWYSKIDSIFREHGFICNDLDYNLYNNITNGHYVILIIYVDDILLTSENHENIMKLEMELEKGFEMTSLRITRLYIRREFIYFEE